MFRNRSLIWLLGIVGLLALVISFVNTGEGRTLTVDIDGSGDHISIQEAINASADGDTIIVKEGIYLENISVTRSLTLEGAGNGRTIIDQYDYNIAVGIECDKTSFIGFSLKNCVVGILIEDSNNCIINDNDFFNCSFAIGIVNSRTASLSGNRMMDSGIYITENFYDFNAAQEDYSIEHWNTHTIDTSNTVNGKPVLYYTNVSGITLSEEAGQIILANCTFMSIDGYSYDKGLIGIQVVYSANITISNNSFICNENIKSTDLTPIGLELYFSDHNYLINNTILSCNFQNYLEM